MTKKRVKNHGELPKPYVKNTHPAIIEEHVWDLVQLELLRQEQYCKDHHILNGRYHNQSDRFPFAGRITCGTCGSTYMQLTDNDGKKYWRCKTFQGKKGTLIESIEMICDDEESMLIVGRQVRNEKNGRSDLTAVDNDGNIVLIEIKRDRKDIEHRREAFEFQAIRYAASYATIDKTEDLVNKVYAPYIEKYRSEFQLGELTAFELGIRKLNEFLQVNDAQKNFNEKQRIILVASDFDEQTLSAVAWLNSNNVNICCYRLTPYKLNQEVFFYVEKLLPVTNYDDYYVNLMDKSITATVSGDKKIARRSLPKIDLMLDWGVVKEGDIIIAKGTNNEAELLVNGNVVVNGEEMSMQTWLKEIYGWSSVQTYAFAVHKDTGKTLSQIRDEYLEQKEREY